MHRISNKELKMYGQMPDINASICLFTKIVWPFCIITINNLKKGQMFIQVLRNDHAVVFRNRPIANCFCNSDSTCIPGNLVACCDKTCQSIITEI